MYKDTIILMEKSLVQSIEKEEEKTGRIIQHHTYGRSASTRNTRNAYNLHPINHLTSLFEERIPLMELTLWIVRYSGQHFHIIATLYQFESDIITSECLRIKMIGKYQATLFLFHNK